MVKEESKWELRELATATGLFVVNKETGAALSDKEVLLLVLNRVEEIGKAVVGK
jgi:hypothetical protein